MYNLIPHIDKFDEGNWYTLEELKMLNESRKMLHLPTLNSRVHAFACRSRARMGGVWRR